MDSELNGNKDNSENGVGDKDNSTSGQFAIPKLPSAPKRSDHLKSQNEEFKAPTMPDGDHDKKYTGHGIASQSDTSDMSKQAQVPYTEPLWSGRAEEDYNFEVLKNGSIIGNVSLSSKPFHVFGRLPSCDVTLEHPSLSRYHAVIQYSVISTETHEKGWYVYDLDSTHGTWLNKKKITPKVYHRLRVGHIVKFGGSSRLHILQGPRDDTEEESEMSVTELKEQKERLVREAQLVRQAELHEEMERMEADKKAFEDNGCAWGMTDDAQDIGEDNPYASLVAENESLYIDDPKKALKGFYDREGCDLPDYQFTEVGPGKHKCTLDLPVDGPNGEDLVAEAVVSGKRKDAVIACALEACRILDKFGLLRSSTHESRKRKQKKWEEDDFYDSDEDTFLDRTGTIEKKRFQRMKKAGKDEAETYESLMEKYNKVIEQIQDIEKKLQKAKAEVEAILSEEVEMDELDAYMISIKNGAMDTKTRMQLKGDLMRLKTEEQKLRKLVNIAKPASLLPFQPQPVSSATSTSSHEPLPKKVDVHPRHAKKSDAVKTPIQVELKPDDYEEEDDEEERATDKSEKESITSRLHGKSCQVGHVSSAKGDLSADLKAKSPTAICPSESRLSVSSAVKGPSLPPASNQIKEQRKSAPRSSTTSVLENLEKERKKAKRESSHYDLDTSPDYAMWLPPSGQTGDGRTSLNEKLGY